MTGEKISEVLYSEIPLYNRSCKVAAYSDNGKCKRNQNNPTVADCMYCKEASVKDGKQHNIAYNRTDNTAYRTLNSLFGTYLRAELVLSEKSSRKICKRVRKPSGKQSEQYKEQIVVESVSISINKTTQ